MENVASVVLGEEEHQDALHRLVIPAATSTAAAQPQPVVVFVAGQPGAGKTAVADLVQAALGHRGEAVRVCRDLYKPVHREYAALLDADVRTAGAKVRPDTSRWQASVEEYVRARGFDAVVESALADEGEFRAVSAAYRRSGHRIEVVAVATAEALAQLGVLDRYFTDGFRYVSWENQDSCAKGMLRTLAVIEAEQLADRVAVVRRGLEPLYDNELTNGAWARPTAAAAAVARADRLRPWSAPQTRVFRRELTRAEVLVHDERLPADRRLAVSRDAERAAAAAEPVRRIAQPLPGPPGTDYHRLSGDEHRWIFDELIAPSYLRRTASRPDPVVVYLTGEPGTRKLEASRMLRRAMRPGTVRLDPRSLRGSHPDYSRLVTDSPRLADEAVRADAEIWQAEAEAYVRERHGDLVIEAGFATAADFETSAGRFARAGYRIEVVALAGRAEDSRQRTLVNHARALQLDVITALPTPAAHARARRAGTDIVAAAASRPDVSAVTVINGDHQALGRDAWAGWALAAEQRRPYTDQEAARFHTIQRALHRALPRMREEVAGLTAQARPLMPALWQPRPVENRPAPGRLPVPAGWFRSPSAP
ncbi:zeta toxin family protein (plasmid) [Streptomyces sp. NBC_00257]|uniref:zeta toxin family protein n=1 Tax=unclassified Streptomyces TaxID=2593676 RepID=UPI002251B346|nr:MULTISPECIES: zeta toxin family protein [unclassified Streptomyces]MCX5434694.1 zeta toxin family protein [Streptomyces sp. NBC_00062]